MTQRRRKACQTEPKAGRVRKGKKRDASKKKESNSIEKVRKSGILPPGRGLFRGRQTGQLQRRPQLKAVNLNMLSCVRRRHEKKRLGNER